MPHNFAYMLLDQKRVSDHRELGLQMVVNTVCVLGTELLCKSIKWS